MLERTNPETSRRHTVTRVGKTHRGTQNVRSPILRLINAVFTVSATATNFAQLHRHPSAPKAEPMLLNLTLESSDMSGGTPH